MENQEFAPVLAAILDVGELMLTSGAEVNRVENTIQRMGKAYGCSKVDVFTITSSIVVTVKTKEGQILTQTRRIYEYVTNMGRVEGCNKLARKICDLAELLARFLRTPVTILLVPMLVPLIPGSDLYYTTSCLVRSESHLFSQNLNLLIREAGAIAFGIILVTCLIQTVQRARSFMSCRRE